MLNGWIFHDDRHSWLIWIPMNNKREPGLKVNENLTWFPSRFAASLHSQPPPRLVHFSLNCIRVLIRFASISFLHLISIRFKYDNPFYWPFSLIIENEVFCTLISQADYGFYYFNFNLDFIKKIVVR